MSRDEELTRDQIQQRMAEWVERAESFQDTVLRPQRVRAIEYFMGQMADLPAPEGRSQLVTTEVRDTIRAQLPGLMRIFLGPERVAELIPRRPEQEQAAKQGTDLLNLVLTEDNDGFREFYAWFKDALLGGMGVVTWWWEPFREVITEEMRGLTPEQVALLDADDNVAYEVTDVQPVVLPDGTQVPTYSCRVTRLDRTGRAKFTALPPEDFLFEQEATSLDDAAFVGYRMDLLPSDLAARGFDEDEIALARTGTVWEDDEHLARQPEGHGDPFGGGDDRCRIYEIWGRVDGTLVKGTLVGSGKQLVRLEPAHEIPFALCIPDPTPHTLTGLGTADLTMDLQRAKTAVTRGVLDSLALTLTPRTEIVEGAVNLKDVMNPEIGAVVRVTAPGMMREVTHDFVGREGLLMLQYLDEVRENRTGISKASMGLDADALQSSTRAAVAATVQGRAEQLELIARIFAETGVKRLLKGLLGLLIRHQDVERVVRLRGKWVNINPRAWDAGMDVRVNVALGLGTNEEKMTFLLGLAQKQEQWMQMLGPLNPLSTLSQYRTTIAKMIELGGYPHPELFVAEVDDQKVAEQLAQQSQQSNEPSPEQVLAQAQLEVERMKAEKEFAIKQADLALKREELALKAQIERTTDDRERDATELDAYLKASEMELKYGVQVQLKQVDAAAEDAKLAVELTKAELDAAERAKDREAQVATTEAQLAVQRAEKAEDRAHASTEGDKERAVKTVQAEQAAAKASRPAGRRLKVVVSKRDDSGKIAELDVKQGSDD